MNKRVWMGVVAVAAMLATPSLSLAQAPGGQASPAAVYGKILNNMEREIVGAAEAMPADKYNFAPTNGNFKGVRTFGEQVKHLAQANFNYFSGFGVKPERDPKAIAGLTSKDEIVKALQDSYAFAHHAVDGITPENAFVEEGPRHATRAGQFTMGLAHSNDHYGQMVEYLRMNGIIPPASRR